jgi:hypothetical protein
MVIGAGIKSMTPPWLIWINGLNKVSYILAYDPDHEGSAAFDRP